MAILLERFALRLGIVTGRDLAQACRDHFHPKVSFVLWVLCEVAIIACDLAEVIGSAIALNLLFGIPLIYGVLLTVVTDDFERDLFARVRKRHAIVRFVFDEFQLRQCFQHRRHRSGFDVQRFSERNGANLPAFLRDAVDHLHIIFDDRGNLPELIGG